MKSVINFVLWPWHALKNSVSQWWCDMEYLTDFTPVHRPHGWVEPRVIDTKRGFKAVLSSEGPGDPYFDLLLQDVRKFNRRHKLVLRSRLPRVRRIAV